MGKTEARKSSDGGSSPKGVLKAGKISIFDFDNYRSFILAKIEERRASRSQYKRGDFAKAIGFSSDSGLNMVLTGKRELRPPYLDLCIKNLKLGIHERLYFEAMVRSDGLSKAKRRGLLREVEMLSGKWIPAVSTREFRLIDVFVAQQILCLRGTFLSAADVKSRFRYEIPDAQVSAILEWMAARGYVEKKEGAYKVLKSVMIGGDEFPNAALRSVHSDGYRLAERVLEEDPIEKREFQTYYFTVDKKRFSEMKHRVKKMVLDVISEFETELDADTVVQMQFNLFEAIRS